MLALGLALIQGTMPIVGARTDDPVLMSMAAPTAVAQFAFVAMAFAALAVCYVISDFSVLNVFENSNSQMPFIYRLTSIWGNHEGSMMLWVSILTFFGALVVVFGNNLPPVLKANALAVQAWIAAAFHLFILTTSIRLPVFRKLRSRAGISIRFAGSRSRFSSAAALSRLCWVFDRILLRHRCFAGRPHRRGLGALGPPMGARRLDVPDRRHRRRVILGLLHARLGRLLVLGSGREPSLMPWLAGTALLHSAVVMEKRGALKIWTILLAILTFSLSLIGTFLVRSGVLTSVHTFATDPMRGVFILAILVVFIGGALALYGWRAPLLKQGGLFAPISREGALVFNNLFLTTACATVFVGTLYPLALEALTGEKISVGPPFFNATFGPLFIPLMVVMPFGPLMGWKRGDLWARRNGCWRRQYLLRRDGRGIRVRTRQTGAGAVRRRLAVFVMAGAITDIVERTLVLRVPFRVALRRAIGLPRSAWGTACAFRPRRGTTWHRRGDRVGQRTDRRDEIGDSLEIAHYRVTFTGLFSRQGPNYHDMVGRFLVRRMNGELIGVIEPSRRSFPSRNMTTTEAALMTRGVSQLYLSLGDPMPDGSLAVRLYFKPHVLLIWLGAGIMLRRCLVAFGPAAACRCTTAGKSKSDIARGGMKAARRLFAFTLLIGLLRRTLLLAVQPDEMLLSNPVREADFDSGQTRRDVHAQGSRR